MASLPTAPLDPADVDSVDVDEVIKALAHPIRRDILAWLKDPQGCFVEQEFPFSMGVCAGKIFCRSGLSQSTVSAHLAQLQAAGLVTTRKVGQWVLYARNDARIAQFLQRLQRDL